MEEFVTKLKTLAEPNVLLKLWELEKARKILL